MEQSKISSSSPHQTAHGAHAAKTRGTAQSPTQASAADAGDGVAGGFLALLAALGGPAAGDGGDGDGATGLDLSAWAGNAPEGLAADAAQGALAAGVAAGGAAEVQANVLDASTVAAWQGVLGQGPALQQSPAGGGDAGAATTSLTLGLLGSPQGNIVAETAQIDAAADLKNGAPPVAGGTPGRAFSRLQSMLAQKADATEAALGRLPAAGAAALPSTHQAGAAGGAAPSAASESASAASVAFGATGHGAGRAGEFSAVHGGLQAAAGAAEGLLAGAVSAREGGGSLPGGGRSGEGRLDVPMGVDGAGGPAPAEPGMGDAATVYVDPTQAGAEEQVAEQVAYWVNQKTQNAELTLTRDGQPVEVSVSLSGNEAHVSFRSDQAHTRELLDQSMAQLSDLLRSEGLVLSGMTVGTSSGQQRDGAGDSDRQGGRREGGKQAQVVAATPRGSASLLRGPSPDRALDVFA